MQSLLLHRFAMHGKWLPRGLVRVDQHGLSVNHGQAATSLRVPQQARYGALYLAMPMQRFRHRIRNVPQDVDLQINRKDHNTLAIDYQYGRSFRSIQLGLTCCKLPNKSVPYDAFLHKKPLFTCYNTETFTKVIRTAHKTCKQVILNVNPDGVTINQDPHILPGCVIHTNEVVSYNLKPLVNAFNYKALLFSPAYTFTHQPLEEGESMIGMELEQGCITYHSIVNRVPF